VTTLGIPTSDCDLTFLDPNVSIRALAKLFRKSIGKDRVIPITDAKVPICKFFDNIAGIHCDINTSNILGVINSRFLKIYVDVCPLIRPLVILVKHWASERGLNESPNGGNIKPI
jgi:DNA polymerase sigma